MKARGRETLIVSSAAVGLASLPNAAAPGYALIRVEGARVMYRDDGTDPTAAIGQPLYDGDTFHYNGPLADLRFIRRDGTDATLYITYYGNQPGP